MKTKTIPSLIEAVQLAIRNTSENREIQQKMSGYGYTPKRMQEGKALLAKVQLMNDTQQQHYTHARTMSQQIRQESDTALEVFREHVAIAKTAFRKEPLVIQELKIKKISNRRWGWVQQAINFYHQADAYLPQLQQYGAAPEAFQQNQAAAQALLALKAQRLKKKGDAENSTQAKAQAIRELRAWYGEFRKIARIAFQETPQILETFGVVVLSPSRKRKKAEAKAG